MRSLGFRKDAGMMPPEMTLEEFKAELKKGTRAILQIRHAERPKVGMEVHALELHAPPVQVEAVVRGELGCAEAIAVLLAADRRLVELRICHIP